MTYTWLTAGTTSPWVNTTPPTFVSNLTFPAGSTLRKVLIKASYAEAVQTGQDYTHVGQFSFQCNASFTSGANNGKQIFSIWRRIPSVITALYDPLTAQRIYTQYAWAGDNELGFDMRAAWGKKSDPSYVVRVGGGVYGTNIAGLAVGSTGYLQATVKLLYQSYP